MAIELTKSFDAAQYSEALESWSGVDLRGKSPVFASLFGDVFLSSEDGYWFLDVVTGSLSRPWATGEAMETDLALPAAQEQYLLASVAAEATERGMSLGPAEVYDFVHSPSLGGAVGVDNLRPTDFVVAVNIAGQIHAQIRDLPPGTRISGFTKTDPSR